MFSNLSLGYEYSGAEMWIIPSSRGGYAVVFQCSADAPGTPVIVKPTVKENEISFTIPSSEDEECDGFYKGTVTESGFDGTHSKKTTLGKTEEYTIHLKRRQTYWQSH